MALHLIGGGPTTGWPGVLALMGLATDLINPQLTP